MWECTLLTRFCFFFFFGKEPVEELHQTLFFLCYTSRDHFVWIRFTGEEMSLTYLVVQPPLSCSVVVRVYIFFYTPCILTGQACICGLCVAIGIHTHRSASILISLVLLVELVLQFSFPKISIINQTEHCQSQTESFFTHHF